MIRNEMGKETLREKAIESVEALLVDIESSAKRSVAVFGAGGFLTSILPSFIDGGGGIYATPIIGETYTGERRDLKELLGCKDWVSTALAISSVARRGNGCLISPGDYFRLPVKAECGSFDGLDFKALDIPDAELVVVQATLDGKIIFNFEEILFYSAINEKPTSEGGFKESALCKYLNIQFLAALDPIRGVLQKNRDGNLVTLPTLFEVFGDDGKGKEGNWEEEPRQLEYFKSVKNRIRVKDNETHWWWIPTAAGSSHFAVVNNKGNASIGHASHASGGVAPAICIF